jgi:hypothetical protein
MNHSIRKRVQVRIARLGGTNLRCLWLEFEYTLGRKFVLQHLPLLGRELLGITIESTIRLPHTLESQLI